MYPHALKIVTQNIVGILIIYLAGCGTFVPNIQEFWGTPGSVSNKVQIITEQVHCELKRAIQLVALEDIATVNPGGSSLGPRLGFLKGWGADLNLILTVEEKSTIAPSVNLNTPLPNAVTFFPNGSTSTQQSYSTGIGASLSSDGYRQEKLHILYSIPALIGSVRSQDYEAIFNKTCVQRIDDGTLFIQSDLKLYEWLHAVFRLQHLNEASFGLKNDFTKEAIISHEVRFQIVSSGSVNPTWRLLNVSAGTGAFPLFNTSRDRTQDLIITLGPVSSQRFNNTIQANELAAAINSSGRFR